MSAPIDHYPNFLAEQLATEAFKILWEELDWKRVTRRREYWTNEFNRPYSYGKPEYARVYEPQPTHNTIDYIWKCVELMNGTMYEGCFLNGYETNQDALEWHADDDPGIDHNKPIAIVTLYDGPVAVPAAHGMRPAGPKLTPARTIQFMPQGGTKADVEEIHMAHGSLILMRPGMQQTHFHRIPKAGFVPRPRISLTFRGLIAQETAHIT